MSKMLEKVMKKKTAKDIIDTMREKEIKEIGEDKVIVGLQELAILLNKAKMKRVIKAVLVGMVAGVTGYVLYKTIIKPRIDNAANNAANNAEQIKETIKEIGEKEIEVIENTEE